MPGVNPALASAGAVVLTVAAAAAIAIYESPELRRYAEDVRRKIAVALHSLGDEIHPSRRNNNNNEPLFNRPEDLDGFLQSRNGAGAEPGVDADEETRRRQREELMYWNRVRLEQQVKKQNTEATQGLLELSTQDDPATNATRSFDDFLRQDANAEKGTFVYNSGAAVAAGRDGLRHRGETARGMGAFYANPFSDEHGLDTADEVEVHQKQQEHPEERHSGLEILSDIYSATTFDDRREKEQFEAIAPQDTTTMFSSLIDLEEKTAESTTPAHMPSPDKRSVTLGRETPSNNQEEHETSMQSQSYGQEAYASIQAWAQESSREAYTPVRPTTPSVAASEPDFISHGDLTPTDSLSVVGPEDARGESASSVFSAVANEEDGRRDWSHDVMSVSEGMATPASWSEVGSVISENEHPLPA